MKSNNIPYLPAVDHLRAYAAVLILIYHGLQLISSELRYQSSFNEDHWIHTKNPIFTLFIEGHTAVALFMVLSGFIFTYGAISKDFDYKAFFLNRILRIYPLFVLLIICGVYIYPTNFSLPALVQTLLMLSNLPGCLNLGPLTGMFWAISVEFQFYLLFPLLLLFYKRYGVKLFVGTFLLLTVIKLGGYFLGANPRELSYFSIIGRLDQFLLGMVAAIAFIRTTHSSRWWVFLLPILVLIILGMLYGFHLLGGWPNANAWKLFWPTLEGLVYSGFILVYVKVFDKVTGPISRMISSVGAMSFSIYLIHYVVIDIAVKRRLLIEIPGEPMLSAAVSTALIILPLTLMIAYVTFNVIERPFLTLRKIYVHSGNLDRPPNPTVVAGLK